MKVSFLFHFRQTSDTLPTASASAAFWWYNLGHAMGALLQVPMSLGCIAFGSQHMCGTRVALFVRNSVIQLVWSVGMLVGSVSEARRKLVGRQFAGIDGGFCWSKRRLLIRFWCQMCRDSVASEAVGSLSEGCLKVVCRDACLSPPVLHIFWKLPYIAGLFLWVIGLAGAS